MKHLAYIALVLFTHANSTILNHFSPLRRSIETIATLFFMIPPTFADQPMKISGIASISSSSQIPPGDSVALYVTVRPEGSSFSKPIPIMSKRIGNIQKYPVLFTLDYDSDKTVEGAQMLSTGMDSINSVTVSARLDTDGMASTRSPEDLVGRGNSRWNHNNGWNDINIELVGRGITGKFITGSKR